jgi:hypothetical protein
VQRPDPPAASVHTPTRCERCGRFVGEEALEGWTGGPFGDYNSKLYCAFDVGCNSVESASEREANPLFLGF